MDGRRAIDGDRAGMRGQGAPPLVHLPEPPPASVEALHASGSAFRYCTSFLVEGEEIDRGLVEVRRRPH